MRQPKKKTNRAATLDQPPGAWYLVPDKKEERASVAGAFSI
jgi:hypothetical protein